MAKQNAGLSFDPHERDLVGEIIERFNAVKRRGQILKDPQAPADQIAEALRVHPEDPPAHYFAQQSDFEQTLRSAYRLIVSEYEAQVKAKS
ncbi:MAG: hypothetical protein KDK78_11435 [Chlamydiia bacterium]|nr:hypothetical protein [Chlamydiia bacterium]